MIQNDENIDILKKKIEELSTNLEVSQQQSKDLEVRLQQSKEQSWSGKWELDLVTKEVIWSSEMFLLLGLNKDSSRPDMKLFYEKLPPVCKDKLSGAIQKCFLTRKDYSFEHYINPKEQEYISARTDLKLVLNEANAPIKLLGITTDITKIKTAQQELEKLSTIASTTSNAVLMTNTEMQIEWCNEGFTRMLGFRMEEVKDKALNTLLYDPMAEIANKDFLHKTFLRQHSENSETQMVTKKRQAIWVLINITPLLDYELNPEKYILVISDITQQKEHERILELQKIEISSQKDQLEITYNQLRRTMDELTRAKISRKSIIFSFCTLIVLVLLSEYLLDPIIEKYTYNFFLGLLVKIAIAFLLKPVEGIYERILIKRVTKAKK